MSRKHFVRWFALTLLAGVWIVRGICATADTNRFVVGSPNVAVADPLVPRPESTPCVVPLFHDESFGEAGANTRMDATPHPYAYRPPVQCKAPWAKVVLEADFSVGAGHQYDRTASVWLGGVNLYFGTTEEPSPQVAPNWHVERDLTDYSSLFTTPQNGSVMVNNWIDEKRASMIRASARLLFYPVGKKAAAAKPPDAIYPIAGSTNTVTNLNTGQDEFSRKLALPRNVERAYLDVFAQSQFHDEFWYNCLPDEYVEQTSIFAMKRGYAGAPARPRACGGGNFREVEVSIDGQPAGLAPIYPWIFTGGIDPYLWRPTPGVQTLNFMPYRIDLTPFAGVLSDGSSHDVALRVIGANHYFSVTAALLIYENAKASHTGGAVTRNTLVGQPLAAMVTSTLGKAGDHANGDILTKQQQQYVIEGYIDTPRGRVSTRVEQHLNFSNRQSFSTLDEHTYRQVTDLLTEIKGITLAKTGSSVSSEFRESLTYPLRVDVLKRIAPDNSSVKAVDLRQAYDKGIAYKLKGRSAYSAHVSNNIRSYDRANINATQTGVSSNSGQHSAQSFLFSDSLGECYRTDLTAVDGKLTAFSEGHGCPKNINRVDWFAHPDGSPGRPDWRP